MTWNRKNQEGEEMQTRGARRDRDRKLVALVVERKEHAVTAEM